MATHTCGGTILTGGSGDHRHDYCTTCGAFRYDTDAEAFPTGADRAANRRAWDDQDERSPETTETALR